MKIRNLGAAAILGTLALGAVALAQSYQPPQLSTLNLSTDLVRVVQGGNPAVGDRYAAPQLLNIVHSYYKSSPATGFTYTFGTNVNKAMFTPSTTLATGAITMPAAPSDGQEACFSSKQIVTTLTVSANTGQSINDAVTTVAAAGHACYIYGLSNATWDRAE